MQVVIAFGVGFAAPWWLLLALLLVPCIAWLQRGSLAGLETGRHRLATVLRVLAVLCAVLALARTRLLRENDRLCVTFLLDRSSSIPAESRKQALEVVRRADADRDEVRGDRIGVIVFGRDAGVEQSPRAGAPDLGDIRTLIDAEGTSIEAAVRLASASFPEDVGGRRMVLLSDGNENVGRAVDEVRAARSLGATLDVVPIRYDYPAEISVEKVVVDPEVQVGQPFAVQAVVRSTVEADVRVHLLEGGSLVSGSGDGDASSSTGDIRVVEPGKNVFVFSGLRREDPGLHDFTVRIEPIGEGADTVARNNRAAGFTVVEGEQRVLLCAPEPELDRPLRNALATEQVAVDVVTPEGLPREMEGYLDYGAVILSNVGAHRLNQDLMKLFRDLVRGLGTGFVMIGGEESFGAGGYRGTPVEELLPVNMEVDQKRKLPNGALAMVVHSCELGNGNWWARKVVQQAIRLLSPQDWAGVLYHDFQSQDRWLFPMTKCTQKPMMYGLLQGFNPGDMMSFQPILQLAFNGLQATPASIKHIVILSDGDPGMPNPSLMRQIVQARITVSAICYGAHGNTIPPGFRQLAQQGGGNFHYLRSPEDLPEIFIREATKVRKSLVSEKAFVPLLRESGPIVQGIQPDAFPRLDGYVLATPKDLARVNLVHPGTDEDPTQDPVLAAWSFGLGKAVAFTSDAGRRWGKAWVAWDGYQRFWGQLVRWVSRAPRSRLFRVSRRVEDGKARIAVDLIRENGELVDGKQVRGSLVAPDGGGTRSFELRQTGPGRYESQELSVDQEGTHGIQLTTEVDGQRISYTTGVNMPYSPEYRQLSTDLETLRRLAEAGGGRLVRDPGATDFFSRDFEPARSVEEVWRSLLIAAICLFFADIFVRRVMVDARAVARRVGGVLGSVRRRREAEETARDERLATLLRTKAKAHEARGEGAPGGPRESEDAGVPGLDERFDAGAGGKPWPEAPAPGKTAEDSGRPGQEGTAREEAEPQSTTGRLLRAKRKALRRDEDDEADRAN